MPVLVDGPGGQRLRWDLADPDRLWSGVRLQQDIGLDRDRPTASEFTRLGDRWSLEVPCPDVDRLEYRFELRSADGRVETINDPDNPARAAGVFGEPSVVELPGYQSPWWLAEGAEAVDSGDAWVRTAFGASGRGLRDVPIELCSPVGAQPQDALPLLVAHDGGELDALARVTTYAARTVARGDLPPFRIALLSPLDRDNWYSGSPPYMRTLATSVLPHLQHEVAVRGPVVGYGASLGALSLLATQLRHPGTFGGLMLASGSFFHPTDDPHEVGFRRYWRIVDRVTDVLQGGLRVRDGGGVPWMRIGLVCGTVEENLANNRRMAVALAESGHGVSFAEFRDAHNFTAWRDAFDPHLTSVLADLWR